jgi:hypothetical protein
VVVNLNLDANKVSDPNIIFKKGDQVGSLQLLAVDSTLVGATSSTTSSVSLGLVLGVAIPLGVLRTIIIM